jgi:polyhydroxyalkanoate synthesis regulator phasin
MDTTAIINAAMQQLIDTVSDEVIRKLKAEGTAHATLEPEALAYALTALFRDNNEVREIVRDITTDMIDCIRLSDNSEFEALDSQVNRLEEKLDELEATPVDADNSDFDAAVMQVLRNNI